MLPLLLVVGPVVCPMEVGREAKVAELDMAIGRENEIIGLQASQDSLCQRSNEKMRRRFSQIHFDVSMNVAKLMGFLYR